MKIKKTLSLILAAILAASSMSIAASAATVEDSASVGSYSNQSYLETYASNASSETDLGSTYSAASTTFKTWSPDASAVKVKLYKTGSDSEAGAAVIGEYDMTKNSTTGVWSATITGDHKNQYYTYLVTKGGTTNETQDVYSKATGVNGRRSMVVDLDSTDPEGWDTDNHVLFDNAGEAVVWEVHVRDFSISSTSGVSEDNKGKYLAFTEGGTKLNGTGSVSTAIDYLVEQGINCVQLQPVYDFGSVAEDKASSSSNRNWGYDPENYNVPEGSYSTNPYDGNVRINEFKQMVQALHDRNISVVMDVVYNHTYSTSSCFEKTVPGYYYRLNNGAFNNGSGCGNETASDKQMFRKYMVDSVAYWASEYHIDGFRFDLMALHDVATMNAIRSKLDGLYSDQSGKKILMYGEPWSGEYGGNGLCTDPCTKSAVSRLDSRVGVFNDTYRDAIKGDTDGTTKGFVQGNTEANTGAIVNGVKASGFGAKSPAQAVAYADAHDNLILWDKIVKSNGSSAYTGTNASYQNQVKEVMTLLLTSQGIPFMTAGSEFGRTKKGDSNSYKSSDDINGIDWNRVSTMSGLASWYKGLVAIRTNFTPLHSSSIVTPTFVSDYGDVVGYYYTNSTSGEWSKLCVLVNGSDNTWSIDTGDSGWTVLANSSSGINLSGMGSASQSVSVAGKTSIILAKGTCSKATNVGYGTLTVNHVDENGTVLKTQNAKYRAGSTYRALPDTTLLYDNILKSTTGTTTGTVAAGGTYNVTFTYGSDGIPSGYVTTNYTTSGGTVLAEQSKVKYKQGQTYDAPLVSISGYELDTDSFPANVHGTFSGSDVTVNYIYKPLATQTTTVHYYKSNSWATVKCYAYTDAGVEVNGKWDANPAMTSEGSNWYKQVLSVPSANVMFHSSTSGEQEPGQNEPGYPVAGEAWIQNQVVSYNSTLVVSHIDLATGEKVAADVSTTSKVSSTDTYTTSAVSGRNDYIAPANANGTYGPGVVNVVYLYTNGEIINTDPTETDPIETDPIETDPTVTDPIETDPIVTDPVYEGKVLIGDVNDDGDITIVDATLIQKYIAKLITLEDKAIAAADTDRDGSIDIIDATAIQYYAAELYEDCKYAGTYITIVKPTTAPTDPIVTDPIETDPIETDPTVTVPSGTYTVKFTNSLFWDGTIKAYYWGDSAEAPFDWADAPAMSVYQETNDYGQTVYTIDIPSQYNNVIFTNGTSKTVDINTNSTSTNYYAESTMTGDGYDVGTWTDGGDDPVDPTNPVDPTTPDPSGTYTVKFTNSLFWDGTIKAYYWGDSAEAPFDWADAPAMSVYEQSNDYGQTVYNIDIPSQYNNVIFTNGTSKTVDINTNSTSTNYYAESTMTDGGYDVGTWSDEGGSGTGGGEVTPSGSYYLVGYIDGEEYSGNDHPFANNQVTVTFAEVSYVCIKDSNGQWYMADGFPGVGVSSTTLYNTNITGANSDKLYVPAGTVTLTLVNNGDDTFTLSYDGGSTPVETDPVETDPVETDPVVTDTYTVKFTNSLYWSGTIKAYYWGDSAEAPFDWADAPAMSVYEQSNDYDQTVYTIDIPSQYNNVIFTNGTAQTVDVNTGSVDTNYYAKETMTDGGYDVGTWTEGGDPVQTDPVETDPVSSDTYTVKFTNSQYWSGTIKAYYWGDSAAAPFSWNDAPAMSVYEQSNDYGQTVYTIDIPTQYNKVIFTNGSSQTVDIDTGSVSTNYYAESTKTGNAYNVGTW